VKAFAQMDKKHRVVGNADAQVSYSFIANSNCPVFSWIIALAFL
jgi:hypothetical protein